MTDNEKINEVNTEKAYTLRPLCADDMFPMFGILSKIGLREIKKCFEANDIKTMVNANGKENELDVEAIGLRVVLDIGGLVISHLQDCKDDIYNLLSGLSGMSKKDIAKLPMVTFTTMVIDVFKKEEFKDFFQAVTGLFK